MKFYCRLAIVAVFTVMAPTAMAQYRNDQEISEPSKLTPTQVVQAQVSEGLNLAAGMRHAVREFYQAHGRFPECNAEAGISEPRKILGKYTNSISIGPGDGLIKIEYGNFADPVISGATLTLRVEANGALSDWHCQSEYIDRKYFPTVCDT